MGRTDDTPPDKCDNVAKQAFANRDGILNGVGDTNCPHCRMRLLHKRDCSCLGYGRQRRRRAESFVKVQSVGYIDIRSTILRVTVLCRRSYSLVVRGSA